MTTFDSEFARVPVALKKLDTSPAPHGTPAIYRLKIKYNIKNKNKFKT
jgi:hypothetical protein